MPVAKLKLLRAGAGQTPPQHLVGMGRCQSHFTRTACFDEGDDSFQILEKGCDLMSLYGMTRFNACTCPMIR